MRGGGVRSWSPAGLGLILLLAPTPAQAQSLRVSGGAFNVQRQIYYQTVVHEQTGTMSGGAGSLRLGPLRIGAGGWMGTLKGEGGAANPNMKARTTAATLHLILAPGVQVGAQYEVRRFEADVATTVWTMMGGNVRLEPGLGVPALRGLVDVSVLPSSSVQEGPKLTMAVQVTVGVSLAPPRGGLLASLGYRFERFDIESAGASGVRYEQYGGLVAELGLRLGR